MYEVPRLQHVVAAKQTFCQKNTTKKSSTDTEIKKLIKHAHTNLLDMIITNSHAQTLSWSRVGETKIPTFNQDVHVFKYCRGIFIVNSDRKLYDLKRSDCN